MSVRTSECAHVCRECGFEASEVVRDEPHGEYKAMLRAFEVLKRHMVEVHGVADSWPKEQVV